MKDKDIKGMFHAISSFAIRRRNEFYITGLLEEGEIRENWFVNIPLNSSLSLTVRILAIEDIEMVNEERQYKLIIVSGDDEQGFIDILLGMGVSYEYLPISIEGED
ncbi:hypothetical protein ACTHGU_04880 [Chitinophagaceae bacterium MMS25-I14]